MLLSLCLMMGLLPTTAFAADQPTKRDEYNVYSANVINGGADSRVYAVTIENVDGEDLHYVYSGGIASVIHSEDLMDQIRAGLADPYKSLIPKFAQDDLSKQGFLCFSNDPEKYESMDLDWAECSEQKPAASITQGGWCASARRVQVTSSVTSIRLPPWSLRTTPFRPVDIPQFTPRVAALSATLPLYPSKPAAPEPASKPPAVPCHGQKPFGEYPDRLSDSNSICSALPPAKSATRKILRLLWGTPQNRASRTRQETE